MSFLMVLLSMACSGESSEPVAPAAEPVGEAVPSTAPAPAPAPTTADAEVTHEYTPLDLDKCETLQVFEEGGGVSLRCPGFAGTPVFVTEGDLRFDVDFGVANDKWESRGGFNTLGGTVEWRVRNGEPFAAILRFKEDQPDGGRAEYLGVFKVGQPGAPGCLVEWVAPSAQPSQNEAARSIADSRASGMSCSDGS